MALVVVLVVVVVVVDWSWTSWCMMVVDLVVGAVDIVVNVVVTIVCQNRIMYRKACRVESAVDYFLSFYTV